MTHEAGELPQAIRRVDAGLAAIQAAGASDQTLAGIAACRSGVAVVSYHLNRPTAAPPVIAVIGGTGTGKSTLVNRLVGKTVTAASHRRTFTGGAIAVAASADVIPDGWMGVPRVLADAASLPVRGEADKLIVVITDITACGGKSLALVDSPDLDGDNEAHHAIAAAALRWATAVVFVVTPEKYQGSRFTGPIALTASYEVPRLFVMNKCEHQRVADDFASQLAGGNTAAAAADSTRHAAHPSAAAGARTASFAGDGAAETAVTPAAADLTSASAVTPSITSIDPATSERALRVGDTALDGGLSAEAPGVARQSTAAMQVAPAASRVFSIPRNGSTYVPEPDAGEEGLVRAIAGWASSPPAGSLRGNARRAIDVLSETRDKVLEPLRRDQSDAARAIDALKAITGTPRGIDVSPVTLQLRETLKERSLFYLAGPGRMFDRLKRIGKPVLGPLQRVLGVPPSPTAEAPPKAPDFAEILVGQFHQIQTSIDDVLKNHPPCDRWVPSGSATLTLPDTEARRIADEELTSLNDWMQQRLRTDPAFRRWLDKALSRMPGGKKVTEWVAELIPYFLAVYLVGTIVTHGIMDLAIWGGYLVFAKLFHEASDDVKARTAQANASIERRFAALARRQVEAYSGCLARRIPSQAAILELEAAVDDASDLAESLGEVTP